MSQLPWEAGIPDRDIEGVLNHISGSRSVTPRNYDKAKRESAKRAAMLWWSAEIEKILAGVHVTESEVSIDDVPNGCYSSMSLMPT